MKSRSLIEEINSIVPKKDDPEEDMRAMYRGTKKVLDQENEIFKQC